MWGEVPPVGTPLALWLRRHTGRAISRGSALLRRNAAAESPLAPPGPAPAPARSRAAPPRPAAHLPRLPRGLFAEAVGGQREGQGLRGAYTAKAMSAVDAEL